MRRLVILLSKVLAALLVTLPVLAQNYVTRFTAEVSRGQEFRKEIGPGMEIVLKPTDSGWTIGIVPKTKCADYDDWAGVVNAPYRNYNALHLDSSYGITAQEAVGINPREFVYVTTCDDYKQEAKRLEIVMWPYNHTQQENNDALAKLATLASGKARLTILSAKVSPAEQEIAGKNYGRIDSLKFRLDVTPPAPRRR
jgi:hypothetical protein